LLISILFCAKARQLARRNRRRFPSFGTILSPRWNVQRRETVSAHESSTALSVVDAPAPTPVPIDEEVVIQSPTRAGRIAWTLAKTFGTRSRVADRCERTHAAYKVINPFTFNSTLYYKAFQSMAPDYNCGQQDCEVCPPSIAVEMVCFSYRLLLHCKNTSILISL
jgi:hypothetical protein